MRSVLCSSFFCFLILLYGCSSSDYRKDIRALSIYELQHFQNIHDDEGWFNRALDLDVVESYESYINRYPEGKFVVKATKLLDDKKSENEELVYNRAKGSGLVLREYVKGGVTYEKGVFYPMVVDDGGFFIMTMVEVSRDGKLLIELKSLKGSNEILPHPDSFSIHTSFGMAGVLKMQYPAERLSIIGGKYYFIVARLKSDVAEKIITSGNVGLKIQGVQNGRYRFLFDDINARDGFFIRKNGSNKKSYAEVNDLYMEYIKAYPSGVYIDEVTSLRDKAWYEHSLKMGDLSLYLQNVPEGRYKKEVAKLQYEEAVSKDGRDRYWELLSYIRAYPDGVYAEKVRAELEDLYPNEIKSPNIKKYVSGSSIVYGKGKSYLRSDNSFLALNDKHGLFSGKWSVESGKLCLEGISAISELNGRSCFGVVAYGDKYYVDDNPLNVGDFFNLERLKKIVDSGNYKYSDGSCYSEAEYKNFKQKGWGGKNVWYRFDWYGDCKNGLASGPGQQVVTYELFDGRSTRGDYFTEHFSGVMKDGRRVSGGSIFSNAYVSAVIKNGIYNGKGFIEYSSGNLYEGYVVSGMRDGFGIYREEDKVLVGVWKENKLSIECQSEVVCKKALLEKKRASEIAKREKARVEAEKIKRFLSLGECKIGSTVTHRESWDSKTSSGNILADALFNASVKEKFVIEFEGIVKGFLGNKVEVYLQDYTINQTKGGGWFQPYTGSSTKISNYAHKKTGKVYYFEKSRCAR